MSVIERLGRNLQFSVYSRAVAIFSSLLLTPFILNHVDLGLFGLNALVLSIIGYFNILDLGLSSGISRFIAVFFGEGKQEEIVDVLRFGIKCFVSLGILVASSLFALSFFYEKIFHIELELVEKGRILLLIYAAFSILVWSTIPFRGALNGFQRMDIINKVGLSISLLNVPVALVVLTFARSYLLYIGVLQAVTVLLSSVNILFALKLISNFRFNFSPISPSLRKRLISFSGWYFVAGILSLIIFQVDNLVIGTILGVNAIAVYTIAFTLHNYIRNLNSLLGSPVYYALIGEFGRRDKDGINPIIISATRMHSGISIPVVIIMLVYIDDFILLWVGERFVGSILPCKILLSYWLFNITREILSQGVIGGKGKIFEAVKIESFVAISNLGLSLLLINFIGITGVALGTAIPWIIASGVYVYRFCKILSIPVSNFLRQAVAPNLPHFLLSFILSLVIQKFMVIGNLFQVLIIMAVIYGISVMVGYGLLSPENKRIIKQVMVLRV